LNALKTARVDSRGIEVTERLPADLLKNKIDFCFIALHGKYGEDGTVQGLCEMMGIPYFGSGVLASALSMNKALTKSFLSAHGIATAPFQVLSDLNQNLAMTLPCVIKPVDGGSAIGITIVRKASQIKPAIKLALKHSRQALAEKFISGQEVTAPVLGDQVLPLVEIIPKSVFYDFKAKYDSGGSQHILPARLAARTASLIRKWAMDAHTLLGCRAFSRSDFIVDKQGRPFFLEINSIPGMTETSLYPEAAKAAGYSLTETILKIIQLSQV
jgi:D-alanine-D-alanine ligase